MNVHDGMFPDALGAVFRDSETCDKQTPGQGHPLPIFDRSLLFSRLLNDPKLVRKVVSVFLEETPAHINQLKQTAEKKDARQTALLAHKLVGACANVSAPALAETAREIELASQKGDFQSVWDRIQALCHLFDVLDKILACSGIMKEA